MPEYRAFLLGPDGHITTRLELDCSTVDEAKDHARRLADGHDVELWDGGLKIALFRAGEGEGRRE